jgi:dihydroorotate dehydrogenase (fumarate)
MGASPLVDQLDDVRRLEDAGAAAIVMHSLFEEQLIFDEVASYVYTQPHAESFAEARSYLPEPTPFSLGPDEYLDQLRRIKAVVSVPVIASLNGVTARGWLEYAKLMEEAGADALELNLYAIHCDPERVAANVEAEELAMVRRIKESTRLPFALKLSPYYTSLAHFVRQAHNAGADGFVIFNRFYQPDFDLEELEIRHRVELSHSGELLLRLRWLAVLSAQNRAAFAVTGGVHSVTDAVKALMAGANAVQLVSEVLRNGPQRLGELALELAQWLEDHEYESLSQLRGSMNLDRCPNPSAYERANYMKVLQSWRGLSG